MRVLLTLVLILGVASQAGAALTLVNVPADPIKIGQTSTITVRSTTEGNYTGWLEIADPAVANFAGAPEFTPAGNPSGASTVKAWPDFGAWYQFTVTGVDPNPPISPGDHILVNVIGVKEGSTKLNVYDDKGVCLWESANICVIPEPATIALLGLGCLLLRRCR